MTEPGNRDRQSEGTSLSDGAEVGSQATRAAALVLDELVACFRRQKAMAERAMAQLEPEDWHRTLDAESNSIAVIVQHVAGNLRSRWRDFLTTDGEKADRDRDGEFEDAGRDAAALMEAWDQGWAVAFASLDALTERDVGRTVTIRGEPHTVARAVARSLDHAAGHVGQIILLAKHWRGAQWQTLTIPRRRR